VEALVWCGDRLFSAGIDEFVYEHNVLTGSVKVYYLLQTFAFISCATLVFVLTVLYFAYASSFPLKHQHSAGHTAVE